jgi:hypothetical protein
MTLHMDDFLRDFIGYDEHQITNLDVEWEPAGPAVLVYRAPNGAMRAKPMTEDACRRCRDACMADLQQLAS